MNFWYGLTAILSAFSAIGLFVMLFSNLSAPQEAAGAATAIGFAVVPYVFSRCAEKIDYGPATRKKQAAKAGVAS